MVFHGSNSWAYTRLGHIRDLSQAELKELLGQHDVTITLALSAEEAGYAIPDVTLNSGYPMPVIGLGTWTLSDDQAEAIHQSRFVQDFQMLGYGRFCKPQFLGKRPGAVLPDQQLLENHEAGRVTQCF